MSRYWGNFFFSQLQGIPVYDRERQRVGELRDLAIRWEGETPKVTAIKYAKGIQQLIPVDQIEEVKLTGVKLKGTLEVERLVPMQPDEIYVGKWLLDKQIIDTKGSKLVRVNDIMLAWIESGEPKISCRWRWTSVCAACARHWDGNAFQGPARTWSVEIHQAAGVQDRQPAPGPGKIPPE